MEPQAGNLVRTALQKGWTLFAYESQPETEMLKREIVQAQNIKAVMDKDTGARILILAGFGHASDAEPDMMAGRLKQITGIDPLTIDQVTYAEMSETKYEHPYRRGVHASRDAIFLDTAGNPLNVYSFSAENLYDLCVYHPRTSDTLGRPNWLFRGGRKPYTIIENCSSYPCLVFAYAEGEDISVAIPVDVVQIESAKEKSLALKNGTYQLVLKGIRGDTHQIKIQQR
jgi:hypothetical protein